MELVDMKLPKSKKEDHIARCAPDCESSQDKWPYGLQLRFETEQVEKMPDLKNYKVGDRIDVTAEASVTEVRMSETQSTNSDKKVRYTVELQVEKIACKPNLGKPLEKMSPREYRRARETK